jgi:hypothetical protein
MWQMLDIWMVITIFLWSIFFIVNSVRKKSFLSCRINCQKKIFSKSTPTVQLGRKTIKININ